MTAVQTQEQPADPSGVAEYATAVLNMLEDLDNERTKVDKANVDLQALNAGMQSFIAIAAHDLRSPLASIVGFASLLTENWATLSEENRLKFVHTIDRQSQRMADLVNDLLTLSSIEGGALNTQPERVVVSEVIAQCLAAGSRDTGSVSVSCSPDLVVWVDPLHLGRMIDNFLQNAGKYGEPPVHIDATRLGDMVEVQVLDHGPGVPAQFEPMLFGEFTRADSPGSRGKKGTGLGLSIVCKLAEANGGQARYRATVPQGSCFSVVLPSDGSPNGKSG